MPTPNYRSEFRPTDDLVKSERRVLGVEVEGLLQAAELDLLRNTRGDSKTLEQPILVQIAPLPLSYAPADR